MMEHKRIVRTFTGLTIYPYKKGQCKYLENITSASRYPRKGREPFNGYFTKPKTFACRPIDTPTLQSLFPEYEIVPATKYEEDHIPGFEFNSDIEFTPIENSFVQQMSQLHNNRIFCNLQTGYGKTFILIRMISLILRKAIIICYSSNVLEQWIGSLKNHTSFDPSRALLLQSSEMLNSIASGAKDISNIDIFLCTPTLIGSYAKSKGWSAVSELFEKMHLGIKIFDEAHRNIKMLTMIDAFTNVKRNFYLSADYSQANRQKRDLFFQTFFDAPIVSASKEAIDEMRYIIAIVLNFYTKPSSLEELQITRPNYGFSNFEYMKYEMKKGEILQNLKYVLDSIVQTNTNGYKILIVTSMIEHVQKIYDEIAERYPSYHPASFYAELTEDEKEFALRQSDMIIATIGSFGPGLDIKGIQYVVAMDQFDIITDNQTAGRARPIDGRKAFYIMMNDMGIGYCQNKIQKRLSYLGTQKLCRVVTMDNPLGETK